MTRRSPRSLLEDFIDNELSAEEAAEFTRLLAESDDLRQEYETTARLKQLLGEQQHPQPGETYWAEVTDLILARTIDSPANETVVYSVSEERSRQRRSFHYALVSAVASLAIFFSALLIGSNRPQLTATQAASPPPVLVTASLSESLDGTNQELITDTELANIRIGVHLLGAPGPAGRFTAMPELFAMR